ncbi:Endo-1,4-beta-xylanase Z precursor [Rubripirellula lacrimiformis]|uniref:Beta-xylanase n=1 Tax=Rubripirellula lacrimiformis TaxID=1930273 RepID=A0A517N946_9BACT|nr:endo-1,4-beta-xylanase [Rubripirellula lacrimiformis]QDT03651.1 Endo-1,4-beta-xylanase Z precursor [Rubripirellula lacrimiformis]
MRILSLIVFTLILVGHSDAESPLPAGGHRVVESDSSIIDKLDVRLADGTWGTSVISAVDHPQFEKSLRIDLTKQPQNTWDASFGIATTGPVAKDDILLVGFWLRGNALENDGGAVAEFVFERFGEPYTKSIQFLAESPADGSWEHYWVRFRSLEDYDAGVAGLNFQLGYQRETIEIAGLEAWNFGKDFNIDSLPNTQLTYQGRSPSADWRTESAQRIETLRKRDIKITLVDENGDPRSGVKVSVELDRHAFDFGSAVSVPMVTGQGPDHDRYRETFLDTFNCAVIENGLKWGVWEQTQDRRTATLDTLRWLKQEGVPSRGHVMVWPSFKNSPGWVAPIADHPQSLAHTIDTHIRDVGYATRGLVRDWDVLNEVFDNLDWTRILGDQAMVGWFKLADEVAPDADLYYNDYAGLVRGGFPTKHKDHFEETIRYLKDNGAPIDGIGIQSHFGSLLTPPQRLIAELDRWHALGLKVLITEFDVVVPDDQLQADFTRDFLTACFSHPAVVGVLTWGFWEGAHWKPDAALFSKDWSPTPMGSQWIRLTQQEWTTKTSVVTDQNGVAGFRGFAGTYNVTVGDEAYRVDASQDGEAQRID